MPWWTSFCSEFEGQASIEAAVLLPAMMLCIALLVQPACLLYTRSAMQSAAAQTCRAVATRPESVARPEDVYEEFCRRRLYCVPNVPCFHTGVWTIEIEGSSSSPSATVRISTAVRPLPIVGILPSLLEKTDGQGNVVLEVEVTTTTRPGWVEGGYGDWTGIWD